MNGKTIHVIFFELTFPVGQGDILEKGLVQHNFCIVGEGGMQGKKTAPPPPLSQKGQIISDFDVCTFQYLSSLSYTPRPLLKRRSY